MVQIQNTHFHVKLRLCQENKLPYNFIEQETICYIFELSLYIAINITKVDVGCHQIHTEFYFFNLIKHIRKQLSITLFGKL